MGFSPALNSFWVFCITSQLPPAAQICNSFLGMCAVPNKLYTVHLGTPAILIAKSFETVPRAPITSKTGTITTSSWCIRHTLEANSLSCAIFHVSVIVILRSSGYSYINHWPLVLLILLLLLLEVFKMGLLLRDERLVLEETVVSHQCGIKTLKFGIN